MLADYSRERSFTIGARSVGRTEFGASQVAPPSTRALGDDGTCALAAVAGIVGREAETWSVWDGRDGRDLEGWFCGSPVWPGGPETVELRRRYAEIEATYEGIITLEANGRGLESIDDYFTKSHVLGEGGFGTVWQAMLGATPTKRAVKALPALRMGQGYALKRVRLPLRDAEIEMISKSLLGVSTGRMLQFLKVIASPEATEEHVTRNLLRILDAWNSETCGGGCGSLNSKMFFGYLLWTPSPRRDVSRGPTLRDWLVQLENKPLPETLASELAKQMFHGGKFWYTKPDLWPIEIMSGLPKTCPSKDFAGGIRPMLKAVHFLHRSAGALHRDVKPQNFGFARPVVQELGLGGRFLGGLGRENKSERGVVLILGLTDQPPTLQLFDMGMVHVLPEPVVEASVPGSVSAELSGGSEEGLKDWLARELYALGMGGTMHWIPPVFGLPGDLGRAQRRGLGGSTVGAEPNMEGRVAVWDAIRTGAVASSNANVSKEAMYILGQLLEKESLCSQLFEPFTTLEPLLRATSSEALQCEWLNRSRASSDLRTPTPGARKTVAKAVQQRKVQLPVETERWEERRHLEFRSTFINRLLGTSVQATVSDHTGLGGERLVTRWFEALQGSLPSLVVFHIKALVAIPCCIFSGCSVLQHSTFLLVLTMWALLTASALTAALAACEDGNCDVSNLLQKHRHQSMGAESKAKAATSVALEASSWAILEVCRGMPPTAYRLPITQNEELTEYQVEGSWDWWSEGDIYAHVEVNPSSLGHPSRMVQVEPLLVFLAPGLAELTVKMKFAYKSEVRYDQNKGDLDMQIYLPTDVGTIKVSLYDHHEVLSHDLVGTSTFNPATDCGAEDVCSFTLKFRSTETVVEEVARLQGRWIRGGALRAHAEECNKRGTFVHFEEETREKSTYKLYSVKAEGIENELFYARNGSVFPASLHGVHWMDQRGTSLRKRGKYEEEPDYKQVCALSAEEVFMHFGEAAWNPKTKCATGVRQYGGSPLSGHWSWLDEGGVTSTQWANGNGWNMKYDFCFRDEEMTFIDVMIRISLSRILSDTLGLPSLFPPHVEVTLPTWLNGVSMKKTKFGWDRLTTIGPSWLRTLIRTTFDSGIIQSVFGMGVGTPDWPFLSGGMECHYPLLQIVDGHGQRGKYYQDYLEYINNGTSCTTPTFDCQVNQAPGTVVIGRLEPF
ncbi:Tentative ammonium transporter [Durusdinium trenchii]|uniref:Tentative ammonium transporter n=1 Tax=Durusdinium trenchii TaxID=1381693 RepID=A0ABP0JRA1_9DINO